MKRILVVEDVEFNRDLVVQLLEDTYEVLTAGDGVEGIGVAEHVHPDLILMDLSLPVMDGWEATRRLKADDRTKHIPVLAVTGHALTGISEDAKRAGCDGFITKPCLPEDLTVEIRKVLDGAAGDGASRGSGRGKHAKAKV